MFYANKCILCRAHIFFNLHLVIPIDQVVFLLFIVDCNDSDNHKTTTTTFCFISPD